MTESQKIPKMFWAIGVLALLWNAMGAYDYLMTKTENAAYMAKFTPEQLAFFYGFPLIVNFTWAVAVWGGVIGAILLLMRKAMAVWVFLASLVCMVITSIHNFGMSNGAEVMGTGGAIFTVLIFIIGLLLFMYAKKMKNSGVIS